MLLCLASAAWAFSFGLGSQVVSHWLKNHAAGNTLIGLNHSTYYLGLALASLAVPWATRRWDRRCAAWGMVVSGISLMLFPWGGGLAGWFGLRLLNGMAGAFSLIPIEALISSGSRSDRRTRNFSFYAVALTLGGALGIWAGLQSYVPGDTLAFYLGGSAPLVAGFVLSRMLKTVRSEAATSKIGEPLDWSRYSLSFGTAWFQGSLEGGMLAFLSLYLLTLGLAPDTAGNLMGITMVGVILFQVPVGWLADKLGRLPVLLSCYLVVAGCLLVMPFFTWSAALVLCLFLLGACSGALYPLGLALLGDGLPEGKLARAYACYLAMECLGSQMGSAAMGYARDSWGEGSMFGVGLAALALTLGTWLAVQFCRRQTRKEAVLEMQHDQRRAA